MATDAAACIICLDASPSPIQSGCACRGDSGLAHVDCLVQLAASQQEHRGTGVWQQCQTCKQDFTGAMQIGLAEAWRSRVAGQPAESLDRLAAESHLANALLHQGKGAQAERVLRMLHAVQMRMLGAEHRSTLLTAGDLAASLVHQRKYADAEVIQREVLGATKRVLGTEDPHTLTSAGNLAESLSGQCKYSEAEVIQREVLGVQRRVFGAEDPDTLTSANNLASSLMHQRKYAEAETIQREVLAVQKRLLGAEHPNTLLSSSNLAAALSGQFKYAEAEVIQRKALVAQKRVLGAEHPDTLMTAANVATTLANQGRHVEAEQMLQAALASCHRVFGSAHPTTLATARNLANMRASMRATLPTKAVPPAAAGTARPLPAGTRVLVQRLVAAREHNGKCARVLSFEARTERYVVSLEDGSELSLKAECLARAGCAAAACASEEASSVCARCHAVRYCSRECQRADWKAHKLVCAVLVAHTKPEPTPAPAPAADSAEPTAESSA